MPRAAARIGRDGGFAPGHTQEQAPGRVPEEPPADGPAPRYRHGFSSGVFGLPSNARVVDVVVLNNSTTDQTLRVTLYQADFNARKEPVDPPGPMTLTLQPGVTSGRAFSVGVKAELHIGRYYELVVEMDDPRLLPSVQVWDTEGATVIPGTLIPPGAFVEL